MELKIFENIFRLVEYIWVR